MPDKLLGDWQLKLFFFLLTPMVFFSNLKTRKGKLFMKSSHSFNTILKVTLKIFIVGRGV
jgi:hypothetical protein